jgi:hypothetical protein
VRIVVVLAAGLLAGCVAESVTRVEHPFPPAESRAVRIERCEDRTGWAGERDIRSEATRVLAEKVAESKVFTIAEQAALVLTCDIERFVEGSALKRWTWPGWGATQAAAAVSVWAQPGDRVLATFRSQARVEVGGLYTIGADRYIFGAVFDEIVKQLRQWAAGDGGK